MTPAAASSDVCAEFGDPCTWSRQPVTVSGTLITYNQEHFVQQALESVLAQTFPLDLIVADDGSTDGTAAVINRTLRGYNGPHRVRVLQSGRNRGICGNQNRALRLTEGEYIVLFEGDDVSVAHRVSDLIEACTGPFSGSIAALGSSVRIIDRNGAFVSGLTWPVSRGDAALVTSGGWQVVGCGLAIRRDCFFDIGPITPRLISGDMTLWLRAAFVRNGGVGFIPRPLVDYRIHGENVSSKLLLHYESRAALRNSCRYLLKNEVAHVIELKKIGRYRKKQGSVDPALDHVWQQAFSVSRRRAALVLAVARKSPRYWIAPAIAAFRHPPLRPLALRAAVLAVCPFAYRLYRVFRRKTVS